MALHKVASDVFKNYLTPSTHININGKALPSSSIS